MHVGDLNARAAKVRAHILKLVRLNISVKHVWSFLPAHPPPSYRVYKDDGSVIFHLIGPGSHPIFQVKAQFGPFLGIFGATPLILRGERALFGGINDRYSADYEGRGL
jgi:hypothetical protein